MNNLTLKNVTENSNYWVVPLRFFLAEQSLSPFQHNKLVDAVEKCKLVGTNGTQLLDVFVDFFSSQTYIRHLKYSLKCDYGFDTFDQVGGYGMICLTSLGKYHTAYLIPPQNRQCMRLLRVSFHFASKNINLSLEDGLYWKHILLMSSINYSFTFLNIFTKLRNLDQTNKKNIFILFNWMANYFKRIITTNVTTVLKERNELKKKYNDAPGVTACISFCTSIALIDMMFEKLNDKIDHSLNDTKTWPKESSMTNIMKSHIKAQAKERLQLLRTVLDFANLRQHQFAKTKAAERFCEAQNVKLENWFAPFVHQTNNLMTHVLNQSTRDKHLYLKWKNTVLIKQCEMCSKRTSKLKKCHQCCKVFYCSRKCQKKDWKRHQATHDEM